MRYLFLDDPGLYDEPSYLRGKVHYTGTVFRDLKLDRSDRMQGRTRLGVPVDSTVILVAPGGSEFHSEAQALLFDLVLDAYERLDRATKRLVWTVGQPDHDLLRARTKERSDVLVVPPHQDFTSTLLASDLVITKGNRLPIFECQALGVPSITISFGLNSIDEHRVSRIPTNTALRARGVTGTVLKEYMLKALEKSAWSELPASL